MKWLTLTEIGRRARSKKGALEVSYEHWNQFYQATAKEIQQAFKDGKVELDFKYCGLCRRYWPYCISICPLGKIDIPCTKARSLYSQATIALDKWRDVRTVRNWWAWKRASKALRDKLKELMESN